MSETVSVKGDKQMQPEQTQSAEEEPMNRKSAEDTFDDTLLRKDIDSVDLAAEIRKREEAEIAAKIAYAQRPCGNCGQPRDQHFEVHKGFDMHTPIGIGYGRPTPLAVICPGSVFTEKVS